MTFKKTLKMNDFMGLNETYRSYVEHMEVPTDLLRLVNSLHRRIYFFYFEC